MWMTSRSDLVANMDASRRFSSVALILEDESQRGLIVKASYKPYWTFPGGIIDPGETPKQAAIREAHEEVGIMVDQALLEFVAIVNRKGTRDTYQFLFKAKLPKGAAENLTLQANEIADAVFVSKEEVKQAGRPYGRVIQHWVDGATGYIEQVFDDIKG